MNVLFHRFAGALFGYDFFIAYAHRDGLRYAEELKRRLEERRFACFLDSASYITGDDWKRIGAWSLARTSYLILVASPDALESEAVLHEMGIFRKTGKRILAIDFDGSLSVDSRGARLLGADTLTLRDTQDGLASGTVAQAVLEALAVAFRRARQETKRLQWISAAAVLMFLLAVAALFFAFRTGLALRDVERGADRLEIDRLAMVAQNMMLRRPQRSALMAIEAAKLAQDRKLPFSGAVRTALHATMNNLSGEPLADGVQDFELSPDGRWLAARVTDGAIRLWHLTDRAAPVCRLSLPREEPIETAAFTPDGQWLLVGGSKGTVVKASLPPATRCPALEPMARMQDSVDHIEVSPDGRWLLVFDRGENLEGDWLLTPWPAVTGAPRSTFKGESLVWTWPRHFDPTSRYVVTGDTGSSFCVRDLSATFTRECPRRLQPPGESADDLVLDANGRRMAMTSQREGRLTVWDLRSNATAPVCAYGGIEQLSRLTFSRSGRFLYFTGRMSREARGLVFAIDFAQVATCPKPMPSDVEVKWLDIAEPLGDHGMFGVTDDSRAVTWDASRCRSSVRNSDTRDHWLYRRHSVIARSPRPFVLLAGGARPIESWPLQDGILADPKTTLRGFNEGDIDKLQLAVDGRWLAATGDAGDLRLWHFDESGSIQPELVHVDTDPEEATSDESWSDDGTTCVFQTHPTHLVRWSLLDERGPRARPIPFPGQGQFWISPSGRWLVVQNDRWEVELRDLENPNAATALLPAELFSVAEVTFSPDEKTMVMRYDIKPTEIRSRTGALQELTPPAKNGDIGAVAFASAGDLRAFRWYRANDTDLVEVRAGVYPAEKIIFREAVGSNAKLWFPGDRFLLVEAGDEDARTVWIRPVTRNAGSWRVGEKIFTQANAEVTAVSADGRTVALVDRKKRGRWLLDLSAEEPVRVGIAEGIRDDFLPAVLSADGRWVVLAEESGDKELQVAVLRRGVRWGLAAFDGLSEPIAQVAFSPDSRWLAVGGLEGLVRVYELKTNVAAAPAEVFRHGTRIKRLFFDRGSRFLFSQGTDGRLHRADLDVPALMKTLHSRVGRELLPLEREEERLPLKHQPR